jgi:hypothetical protein
MHIRFRLVAATHAVLLLFTLTAGAAPPPACNLLTAEMATTLAGGPVGPSGTLGKTICGYRPKSGIGPIGLAVEDVEPADEAKAIDVMRRAASAEVKTGLVEGLGDHALLIEKSNEKNVLIAAYRGKVLSLGVPGKMTPELKATMVQVMRQILAKL